MVRSSFNHSWLPLSKSQPFGNVFSLVSDDSLSFNENPIDLPSLTSRNATVARTKQGKHIRKTEVRVIGFFSLMIFPGCRFFSGWCSFVGFSPLT
ncbi:transmembrane protein, putative [Medicago truncatula]|uniref:Transmembrane protein, putative n=1 Tax=Medicago truncatula TaxID=3880 RepID=A0A072VFP1_MEDTR|nr:transmembrane protein, putative [Medicago truncatula]